MTMETFLRDDQKYICFLSEFRPMTDLNSGGELYDPLVVY